MRYDLLRKRWKHEPRAEQKTVEEELRKSEWVLWKKSLGEEHLSIDPERLDELLKEL